MVMPWNKGPLCMLKATEAGKYSFLLDSALQDSAISHNPSINVLCDLK